MIHRDLCVNELVFNYFKFLLESRIDNYMIVSIWNDCLKLIGQASDFLTCILEHFLSVCMKKLWGNLLFNSLLLDVIKLLDGIYNVIILSWCVLWDIVSFSRSIQVYSTWWTIIKRFECTLHESFVSSCDICMKFWDIDVSWATLSVG